MALLLLLPLREIDALEGGGEEEEEEEENDAETTNDVVAFVQDPA